MEYDNKDKNMDVTDDANIETLQGVLKSEMDDAKDFIDQIDEERADATDYYLGNSPSSTSSMQSEFVSTDVRDSVLFMLPSIMRTFFGTSKVVEFIPKAQKILQLPNNKPIILTTSFNKRILVLKLCTMCSKTLWSERLVM